MDAAKKSLELQAQVRQNAEVFQNTLNDLYSWEKEIKDKEKIMQQEHKNAAVNENHLKTLPVRSHVLERAVQFKQEQPAAELAAPISSAKNVAVTSKATTPSEKTENPLLSHEEKRKNATECKDRGNLYVQLCENEKAIKEYTQAIDIYPDDPVFYTNRALCYLKTKKYALCIKDCSAAIRLNPKTVKAYYRRMQASEELNLYASAIADCYQALAIEPLNEETLAVSARLQQKVAVEKARKADRSPFAPLDASMQQIKVFDTPIAKRSSVPMQRLPVINIATKQPAKELKISDEDIDKLFNSNCGEFVEVKSSANAPADITATSTKKLTGSTLQQKHLLDATKAKQQELTAAQKQAETLKHKNINTSATIEAASTSAAAAAALAAESFLNEPHKEVTVKKLEETAINTAAAKAKNERPLPMAPTCTAQFYANWKQLSIEQKYQYFKSIKISDLKKVLGASFDSATLSDILCIMRDYYVPNKEFGIAADALLEISKNHQIHIVSLFMSVEDQKAFQLVLKSIANSHDSSEETAKIKLIERNFERNSSSQKEI